MSFVRAPNPIWYMVDHIGQPLNDEYWAFFLANTFPYMLQNVYRDPQGMTVWTGNRIEFSPAGTLPDNLYFDPDLVYRIEIRHGDTQADELIWEINNFVPTGGGSINSQFSILAMSNQITNPQFEFLKFLLPITITSAGTYDFAPGWELVITGAGGSTTLTQQVLSGNQNQINNPPFALRIDNNGWTEVFLRQRFDHNGSIWANGAISMSLTGRSQTAAQEVSLIYAPSAPGVSQVVATGILGTGSYEILQGAIDLPASVNTGLSTVAFTDMIIQLPPTGIVDISNIQVLGQGNSLPTDFNPLTDIPRYQQQSSERETDHTFNVYKDGLMRKPIPSYLVGWDFPLNPSQRGTIFSSAAGANTSFYAWDQTIVFQSVSGAAQTSRVTNGYFSISAAAASQFAIIQYLPAIQARELLADVISVFIDAFSASGAGAGSIPITVSLWVTTDVSLPSTAANQSLIGTLNANGKPATFHGTWTEVAPIDGQEAAYTLVSSQEFFDGWWNNEGNALVATATYFAIVIGTGTVPLADSIIFRSVGLQKGSIGTRPAPQSYDQVLRQCQFYYEQSYLPGIAVGTVTQNGMHLSVQNILEAGGNASAKAGILELEYVTVKNTTPTITFYSPANGASNSVHTSIWDGGSVVSSSNASFSANWQPLNLSIFRATYIPDSFTSLTGPTAAVLAPQHGIYYHYVADSRLGA